MAASGCTSDGASSDLAAAVDAAKAQLDPYGTLAEKHTRIHPLAAAAAVTLAGTRMTSLVGCLTDTAAARDKARATGINPPLWSLGERHESRAPISLWLGRAAHA